MINTVSITAGQTLEYCEGGDFFRMMEGTLPMTVRFYKKGVEVAVAEGVVAGYAEKFGMGGFDRYQIYSASAQSIQFVARLGNEVAYDKAPTGNVAITGQQGTFLQVQRTVTNASTQLSGSKADRRYLFVQNNDAAGIVYLVLDWTAATVARGIKLLPGQSFELNNTVPSAAIYAIGSIASNANVVYIEA